MDFFNLHMDLPDHWTAERKKTSTSELLEIDVAECDAASILVLPPLALVPETLVGALGEFIEGHTHGREIVNRFPDEVLGGATKGGLAFAAQHAISTSDDDVWFAMYWALAANGTVQCVVGLAADVDDYEELLPHLGTFVDRVRAA
jgi:hypothetical protein